MDTVTIRSLKDFFATHGLIVKNNCRVPVEKAKTLGESQQGFFFENREQATKATSLLREQYPTLSVHLGEGRGINIPDRLFQKGERKKSGKTKASNTQSAKTKSSAEKELLQMTAEEHWQKAISLIKEKALAEAKEIMESKYLVLSREFKRIEIPASEIGKVLIINDKGMLVIPFEFALKNLR